MGTTSFDQLNVWQKAHALVLEVYRMTRTFPGDERFGITSQMRRAAVSIPANIAEGYGRRRAQDKARLYNISPGSAEELRYFLTLSKDLGYVKDSSAAVATLDEVSRMLRRLVQTTEASA